MRSLNPVSMRLIVASFGLFGLNIAGCPSIGTPEELAEMGGDTPQNPLPAPTTPTAAEPILYVANFGGGITAFKSPATKNGNLAPEMHLFGTQTQFANPWSVTVDNNDALLVANYSPGSVTAYLDAATVNGNLAPARNVFGAATQLVGPTGMAIDRQRDLLFVCNVAAAPGKVLVFENASSAAANGNLAPVRTITSAAISSPYALSLGASGDLYVANTTGSIAVFADAATMNGVVSASRIITSTTFAGLTPVDVTVTRDDQMLVLLLNVTGDDKVATFDAASTRNGPVNADAVLTVSGAGFLYGLAVDSNGVGYLSDSQRNAILVFDDIALINGTLPPDRTIVGDRTQLVGPKGLFVWE